MSAVARLRTWWKALAHRSTLESEMETELRFHIESYAADLVSRPVRRPASIPCRRYAENRGR
jgi:hypothetical protein